MCLCACLFVPLECRSLNNLAGLELSEAGRIKQLTHCLKTHIIITMSAASEYNFTEELRQIQALRQIPETLAVLY